MEGGISKEGVFYRHRVAATDRSTLVFIHGLTGSSSVWIPYEERFADRYNTLSIDLRGHGASSRPKYLRDLSIDRMTDDVLALIETLHIEHAVVVSHSYGTLVALKLINARPQRFTAAIFVSPTFIVKEIFHSLPIRILENVVATTLGACRTTGRPGKHIDYRKFDHTGDWNIRRIFVDIKNTGIFSYLYILSGIHDAQRAGLWKHLRVPSLLVHGDRDSLISNENAREMCRQTPHSKLTVVTGADHVLVINAIEQVGNCLESFLKNAK